jgi:hypothetical protein
MSQQGGPPPGYNPFAVGAQPSGQPNPESRLGGYLPDANVGQQTSLQNIGLKGNVPVSIVGQKERGLIGTFEKQFGVRTKVQFVGFETVKPAEMATQGHGVEGGGANTPPADATEGVGLEDSKYEQFRQGVMGSKHSHKMLHNKMPLPTEFISPLNINPNQTKKIFGENSDSSGGGGGGNATYEQIFGAGVKIYQNGAVHMGFTPESMLGGLNPPATPGMSRSREQGRGGFLG